MSKMQNILELQKYFLFLLKQTEIYVRQHRQPSVSDY